MRERIPNFFVLKAVEGAQTPCALFRNHLFEPCPISHVPVAVCRSVGIRTRGRTAARSEIAMIARSSDRLSSETLDRQPEAKPAHLVLHEGRGLKQRRSGLFWSLPVLHRPARATEEACSSLPGVRIGVLPNPIQGSTAGSYS